MINTLENEEFKNWKDDYLINESLHAYAQNTTATYSRIKTKNPSHKDFQLWKAEMEYWSDYNSKIGKMFIDTEDSAEKEVAKVLKALKNAEAIEQSLLV